MARAINSLVSTDWLAGELGSTDLVILDATAHLPAPGRDARAEFEQGHIPGARFLDLASFRDDHSPLPNALPTPHQFAARMAALGIDPAQRVVLYDDSAVKTASRAWFICRMNGLDAVALLDGGIAKWRAEGRQLAAGPADCARSEYPAPAARGSMVRSKAQIAANLAARQEQVIDARDAGRFTGQAADTVHNLPGGHIPGARNLPFAELFAADGTFRPPADLRAAFERAGIDLDRPVVTSCGSGVTASILLFAMHRLGRDGALYDGSWSEWGADPATPKETGAAS